MTRNTVGLVLFLALALLSVPALGDYTAADANLTMYEERYGEASAAYRRIAYQDEGSRVADAQEKLASLGFYANTVNGRYGIMMETAVRVFCQQLRIGGDGREITPLMLAMLADTGNMPKALSPAINIFDYSYEQDSTQYVAYAYDRLTRASVAAGTKVSFSGQVTAVVSEGDRQTLRLQMEDSAEKIVYLTYEPLPRTTRFQAGDQVTVFGATQGTRALAYDGMETEQLVVAADRIGYAPD